MEHSWINDLAQRAEERFSKWHPETWQMVVEGPAAELAASLQDTGRPVEQSQAVARAYLKLAAEAVGLGYLYPVGETGRANFFSHAWFELLPQKLGSLTPERQTEVLSACWNVGENLETRASWFQSLFLKLILRDGLELESFEEDVRRVTEMIVARPDEKLRPRDCRLEWIFLGASDARFLPGSVSFLAPRVLVVDHRHTGLDDRPKSAQVVWLGERPQVLGAADEALRSGDGIDADWDQVGEEWEWDKVCNSEPRLTAIHADDSNPWRAVCTLETSQFLVAALPNEGRAV